MMDIEVNPLHEGVRLALLRVPGTRMDKAARLGVSLYTLDKWQRGVTTPAEQNLARISRVSGMSQEAIRNGGVDPEGDAA